MPQARAMALASEAAPFAKITIPRRDPAPEDVEIKILYCGVCHSDLHYARNEWSPIMPAVYPAVPGHEIVGKVTRVGSAVKKFRVGDAVGVGCLVDSDRHCPECEGGRENYCSNSILTYGSPDAHGTSPVTHGGYSDSIVVAERFVLRMPNGLDLSKAAPLLCAGITTYSPLKHWKVGPGQKVGIIGLGGLGHMGVKFAKALGAVVFVLTTSPKKRADAIALGAHDAIVSTDPVAMKAHLGSFDFLLDTVSADHSLDPYVQLLKRDGQLTLVGAPSKPVQVSAFSLIFGRRSVSGSAIGGLPETQEMLDFCGQHHITSDVEMIAPKDIDRAWERLVKADVRYRFVIDMSQL